MGQGKVLSADSDAAPSQKILNIAVTQIEAVVEPGRLADDIRRRSGRLYVFMPGKAEQALYRF
jgi:hypothetical protein